MCTLRFGALPQIQAEPAHALDALDAYVANYIREEILQEALVRNLESFARFLEIAALMNGQVLNVAGVAREPVEGSERGFLLETLVLHELRAAQAYQNVAGQLHYWRTPSGSEVDFVWTRGEKAVGIEVKAGAAWRSGYGAALKALVADRRLTAGHGVYTGAAELKDGPVRVWPVERFVARLSAGDILA